MSAQLEHKLTRSPSTPLRISKSRFGNARNDVEDTGSTEKLAGKAFVFRGRRRKRRENVRETEKSKASREDGKRFDHTPLEISDHCVESGERWILSFPHGDLYRLWKFLHSLDDQLKFELNFRGERFRRSLTRRPSTFYAFCSLRSTRPFSWASLETKKSAICLLEDDFS